MKNFVYAFSLQFLQKYEHFLKNFFMKIDENSRNINDVDYLGNGTYN
jgi:hypothetical protein